MKKEFVDKEQQLRRDIAGLEKESQGTAQDAAEPCFDVFCRHNNLSRLGRGTVAGLIKATHIHEGGGIIIKFSSADPYKRIMRLAENRREEQIVVKGYSSGEAHGLMDSRFDLSGVVVKYRRPPAPRAQQVLPGPQALPALRASRVQQVSQALPAPPDLPMQ